MIFQSLFLCIFQFAIYVVKTVTHYSLFRIVDLEKFTRITTTDQLNWWMQGGMVALCAALYGASLWVVRRRVP